MPFWSKKPSIQDQVIELRMSAKALERQYKNCEAEAVKYQKKMEAEVAKNNMEVAKIYAENSVRMKSQAKQYMVMSTRVEAASLSLKNVESMETVSKAIATSVTAIKNASNVLNIDNVYKAMNEFKQACEDSNVTMAGFSTAMNTDTVATSEGAEELLKKAQFEYAAKNGGVMENAPMGSISTTEQSVGTNDVFNRINNL